MAFHRRKFVLIALIGILVIAIGAAFFTKNTRLQKGFLGIGEGEEVEPYLRPLRRSDEPFLRRLKISLDRTVRPRFVKAGEKSTLFALKLEAEQKDVKVISLQLFLAGRLRTDANPPGTSYLNGKISRVFLYNFVENSSGVAPVIAEKAVTSGGDVLFNNINRTIPAGTTEKWLIRVQTTQNARNAIIVGDLNFSQRDGVWYPDIEIEKFLWGDKEIVDDPFADRLVRFINESGAVEFTAGLNHEYPVGSHKREMEANFNW